MSSFGITEKHLVSTYAERASNILVQERNTIYSNIGRAKNHVMLCMSFTCFSSVAYPTLYIRCASWKSVD